MAYDFHLTTGVQHSRPSQNRDLVYREVILGDDLTNAAVPDVPEHPAVILPSYDGQQRFGLTHAQLAKGVLAIGPAGCGKTNALYQLVQPLKAALARSGDKMVILDSKGDFYRRFHCNGDLVISAGEAFAGESQRWNIYHEIGPLDRLGDPYNQYEETALAFEICRGLFNDAASGDSGSNTAFFMDAAAQLMAGVIIHNMREAFRLGRTDRLCNKALVDFLLSAKTSDYLRILDMNPDLRALSSYLSTGNDSAGSEEGQGVLSTLTQMVRRILYNRAFATGTARDVPFSIRDFICGPGARTLFVELDISQAEVQKPMARLLMDLAMKNEMSRQMSNSSSSLYLVCDELALAARSNQMVTALNFARDLGGRSIYLIAGVQNIHQILDIYGREAGMSLLSFGNSFTFCSLDADTRRFASDRCGSCLERLSFTDGERQSNVREGKVLNDWDLLRLKPGQAVVKIDSSAPFLYHFANVKEKGEGYESVRY